MATASATHSAYQLHVTDVHEDSVLGGLEDNPPCPHCLMGPCIAVGELTRIQGSCALDIAIRTNCHKNYSTVLEKSERQGFVAA